MSLIKMQIKTTKRNLIPVSMAIIKKNTNYLSFNKKYINLQKKNTNEQILVRMRRKGNPSILLGLRWRLSGKDLPVNAGDVGSIPVLGRSPEEGNGNPLVYSCLGNPTDRGAWQDTVYENAEELDTTT